MLICVCTSTISRFIMRMFYRDTCRFTFEDQVVRRVAFTCFLVTGFATRDLRGFLVPMFRLFCIHFNCSYVVQGSSFLGIRGRFCCPLNGKIRRVSVIFVNRNGIGRSLRTFVRLFHGRFIVIGLACRNSLFV